MSSNLKIEKVCEWCGSQFVARTTATAYCSHRCSSLAYKERKRQAKLQQFKDEYARIQTKSRVQVHAGPDRFFRRNPFRWTARFQQMLWKFD